MHLQLQHAFQLCIVARSGLFEEWRTNPRASPVPKSAACLFVAVAPGVNKVHNAAFKRKVVRPRYPRDVNPSPQTRLNPRVSVL